MSMQLTHNNRPSIELSVSDLQLRYRSRTSSQHVIQNLSLQLKAGQSLGIVGESGCGKSTLAHAIMGLSPSNLICDGGSIKLNDDEIFPRLKRKDPKGHTMGMIFQDPMTSLTPHLNIGEQMAEAQIYHFKISPTQARERSISWLKKVQLPEPEQLLNKYPHECSGGMCQRIVIAMTLACEPSILIADEPTTALDVITQAKILDILHQAQRERNMSLILVSHDIGVISKVCENMAVMYAGQIAERGPTNSLLQSPQHPYTKNLLAALPQLYGNAKQRLAVIEGSAPQLLQRSTFCAFADRCPEVLESCHKSPPPLQSVATSEDPSASSHQYHCIHGASS